MGNFNPSSADKLDNSGSQNALIKTNNNSNQKTQRNSVKNNNDPQTNNQQTKPTQQPMNYFANNNNTVSMWCWQDDDGEYKPYPWDISQKIHSLNIGDICTVIISNMQYEIKRVAADAAVQTNMKDGHIRLVILQTNNISNNNSPNYHWYWQYNKSYKPFNDNDSKKLDQLSVGAVYVMYIRGTKYEIKKTSNYSGKQKNTKTNTQRNIIRKIKSNNNNKSDDYKNEKGQDENVWCWDNYGSYKPYTPDISQKLDKLKVGQSYTTQFGKDSYEITKISHTLCQQKNMRTQFTRSVMLQSAPNDNENEDRDMEDHKDEKQEVEKWYWKHDNGEFKSCGYNISKTLCGLTVGDLKKIKIQNKWYEFKKTAIDKCDQKNSKTGKIREVRVAIYGWYYNNSDGTFMSYTDEVNKKLDSASIGDTITFSVNKNKYCVTKKSKNSAEQSNLSSKKKRNIFRQLALNKDAGNRNIVPKNKVNELFYASVAKSRQITEVQNLTKNSQNSVIYEKILQGKCKNGRKRENVEKYLWHGTKDISNLKLIIKNGFDRSFNKAAAYGKGTYFAKDAQYSVSGGYCGQDSSGVYHILLCKVIVGDYTVGSSSTTTIPRKTDGTEYETLVNNKTNPSIFVVWRDYHAVPCYLVKYK